MLKIGASIGFSLDNDTNIIKDLFLKRLTDLTDVRMVKKESKYIFLTIERLNFLNVIDYPAPALNYDISSETCIFVQMFGHL